MPCRRHRRCRERAPRAARRVGRRSLPWHPRRRVRARTSAPRPEDAPVTMAVLPARLGDDMCSLSFCGGPRGYKREGSNSTCTRSRAGDIRPRALRGKSWRRQGTGSLGQIVFGHWRLRGGWNESVLYTLPPQNPDTSNSPTANACRQISPGGRWLDLTPDVGSPGSLDEAGAVESDMGTSERIGSHSNSAELIQAHSRARQCALVPGASGLPRPQWRFASKTRCSADKATAGQTFDARRGAPIPLREEGRVPHPSGTLPSDGVTRVSQTN